MDHKSRLTRFYQHYQPDKVGDVDAAITKFAGREDLMWQKLISKYGPEPAAAPQPAVASPGSPAGMDHKSRLTRFYQHYQPDKVGDVDAALTKFAGREDLMWQKLIGKYGPEPGGGGGGGGTPVTPVAAAPAPVTAGTDHKSRLTRFYQHYQPDKVGDVDAALTKFAGREETMWQKLISKYGPEPSIAPPTAAPPTPAAPAPVTAAAPAPVTAGTDHKSRLTRFYQQYQPDKVGDVDAALTKFAGREETMWQKLISKYGPEPTASASVPAAVAPAPPAPTAAAVVGGTDHKSRLTRFYQHYQPDKVGDVDAALTNFAGREDTMWQKLISKYGPEPSPEPAAASLATPTTGTPAAPVVTNAGTDHKSRLTRFYQHYQPDKVGDVDAALTKFAGREETMWQKLISKYGPEPSTAPSLAAAAPVTAGTDHKSRLTRFYQHYQPDKVGDVDAALTKFAGKEETMWQKLISKYGPEPSIAPTLPSVTEAPVAADAGTDHKSRLTRFYQHYQPDKIGDVDAALTKFAGREETMWQKLISKYGPEPAAPPVEAPSPVAPVPAAVPAPASVDAAQEPSPARAAAVTAVLQDLAAEETAETAELGFDYDAALATRVGPVQRAATHASLRRHCPALSTQRGAALAVVADIVLRDGVAQPAALERGELGKPLTPFDYASLVRVAAMAEMAAREASASRIAVAAEEAERRAILSAAAVSLERLQAARVEAQHRHQARVVNRALDLVFAVETHYRAAVAEAEMLARTGLTRWGREEAHRLLLLHPPPRVAAAAHRMASWRALVSSHTHDGAAIAASAHKRAVVAVRAHTPPPSVRRPAPGQLRRSVAPTPTAQQVAAYGTPRSAHFPTRRAATPPARGWQVNVSTPRARPALDYASTPGLPRRLSIPGTTPRPFNLSRSPRPSYR